MNKKEYTTINGNRYEFINRIESTKNGFKHKTGVFKNNIFIGEFTTNYINRTWECWEYQTNILKSINELSNKEKNKIINEYKEKNNIKRLSNKHFDNLDILLQQNNNIKEYEELYNYFY